MAICFLSLALALALVLALAFFPLHEAAWSLDIELIHRDSPNSRLYQPSVSRFDRWRAAAERSRQRARDFAIRGFSTPDSYRKSIVSSLSFNSGSYLMKLSLGTPPVPIQAIADTGSDLTWTNCVPCPHCYKQKAPLFNPANSSSYSDLSCSSHLCLPDFSCDASDRCKYRYSYADSSAVTGVLASERFTFSSASGGDVSIEATVFGCSHESAGFDINESGLVGLGGGELSLVSQLGDSIDNQFSYCLQPVNDLNQGSRLVLGPDDRAPKGEIRQTPFLKGEGKNSSFYILRLVNITIGGKSISTMSGSEDKIVIDSGTEFTILHKTLLEKVVAEVKKRLDLPLVTDPEYKEFSACFSINSTTLKKLLEFPAVSFDFDGAKVPLKLGNVLVRVDREVICLALLSSEDFVKMQVYGNIAQRGFYVTYDLGKRKLSIAPSNCTEI